MEKVTISIFHAQKDLLDHFTGSCSDDTKAFAVAIHRFLKRVYKPEMVLTRDETEGLQACQMAADILSEIAFEQNLAENEAKKV